jgi:DNA-binding PadR family transcriptional regulator
LADVIELAILGLLKERAMHGYELRQRLHELVGTRPTVSFGSIYPALNRLERNGQVAAVSPQEAVVPAPPMPPMTGSFAGEAAAFRASRRPSLRATRDKAPRNKKVYAITPAGESRLAEIIADPSDDERSFPVKVALCRFVDPETRVGLLERRRAALVERLGEGRRAIGQRGDRLDRYLRSLLEHDTEATERDIAWLDRLLTTERELRHGDGAAGPAMATPAPAPTRQQPSNRDGADTASPADGGSR